MRGISACRVQWCSLAMLCFPVETGPIHLFLFLAPSGNGFGVMVSPHHYLPIPPRISQNWHPGAIRLQQIPINDGDEYQWLNSDTQLPGWGFSENSIGALWAFTSDSTRESSHCHLLFSILPQRQKSPAVTFCCIPQVVCFLGKLEVVDAGRTLFPSKSM